MARRYIVILASILLFIAIACGGSDDVKPADTLTPTLALQQPPTSAPLTPANTNEGEPDKPASPESTAVIAPTKIVEPTATEEATATERPTDTAVPPTATSTPLPTATTALPTDTPLPTLPPVSETPVSTEAPSTFTPLPTSLPATETPRPTSPLPTSDMPQPSPTSPVVGGQIVIIGVDKRAEYVDLQNVGGESQDLSGWVLVSEKGDQRCNLGGVVEANAVLRVWALTSDADQGGYNCGFGSNIWNNSDPDPAVLYDNAGNLVHRYP